jgi:hypothetical protein
MLHGGDILEKSLDEHELAIRAYVTACSIAHISVHCTYFCAMANKKIAPIGREREKGYQDQDRRQREHKQLCCLTLAGSRTEEG